jgi:hypothetical protein
MNQSVTPNYRPLTPVASGTVVGTDPGRLQQDGTARPKQPIAVQAAQTSTLARMGGTDLGWVSTGHRGIDKYPVGTSLRSCLFLLLSWFFLIKKLKAGTNGKLFNRLLER